MSGAGVPGQVRARFDDLTPGGASFELTGLERELVARAPGDVPAVLRAAEGAARHGYWVAGFVTYEAASGLDHTLTTVDWPADHPLCTLPLAWLGAFRRRSDSGAPDPGRTPADPPRWRLDRDGDWHASATASIQQCIARGDYYQVNLTARLAARVTDAEGLYPALTAAQGGAHQALIVTGEHTIASASPELFFTREGDHVVTQPMKGTAARGRWAAEDEAAARALRCSPKERAENVMIVDLIRHDLARVARTGSVSVERLFQAHRFPTVWQLTSTVAADLLPGTDLADLFAALFPSGSVTGAPKGTAMAAIATVEGRPRGVYCGAVGYLAPGRERPSARFNVAIRTVTVATGTGYAEYGAGGAITACSDPAAEWSELLAKSAILRARSEPDELIETIRYEPPDRLRNIDAHLARISGSAGYFGFRHDPAGIAAAVRAAVDGRGAPGRVRVTVRRSGAVLVTVGDLPAAGGTVPVGVAETAVDSRDVLLFHKHGDRGRYDRYRRERPECADVILWNERREATESTIANLAVHLDGRWWTPPLTSGLLPGVERARLIASDRLAERVITLDELPGARGLALVSSLRGWLHAVLVPVRPPTIAPRHDPAGVHEGDDVHAPTR